MQIKQVIGGCSAGDAGAGNVSNASDTSDADTGPTLHLPQLLKVKKILKPTCGIAKAERS